VLYDAGQLTIRTDRADPKQLAAPSHWDIAFIRGVMVFFGPISSLFDFLTFAVMLGVFHAGGRPVPRRLVHRIPDHPDPDHLRDPHPAQPFHAQPAPARCSSPP
jgi:hypothetical protein